MLSICGTDCCSQCEKKEACGGCVKNDGHPFGGICIAAECIKKGGTGELTKLKNTLINEFNALVTIQSQHYSKMKLGWPEIAFLIAS